MGIFQILRAIAGLESPTISPSPEALERVEAVDDTTDSRRASPLPRVQLTAEQLSAEHSRLHDEFLEAMHLIVAKHGKTLQIKRSQLTHTDDYGKVINDKFLLECDYFASNVMFSGIPTSVLEYLIRPLDGRIITLTGLRLFEGTAITAAPRISVGPDLTGREYEQHCLQELQAAGWDARVTKATADQGIDLIARMESIVAIGQCKFYANPVGNSAVQEAIAGREFQKADYAFVVTNSTFTPAARSLAAATNVLLLHHAELCDLTKRLGIGKQDPKDVAFPDITPLVEGLPKVGGSPARVTRPVRDIVDDAIKLINLEALLEQQLLGSQEDPLFEEAVRIVKESDNASISRLKDRLQIGYNRSARLIDTMENIGLVSALQPNGSRKILR